MTRAEKLTHGSRNYPRAWMDFIGAYQKDSTRLYCFFEGQDDKKYYGVRIDSIILGRFILL